MNDAMVGPEWGQALGHSPPRSSEPGTLRITVVKKGSLIDQFDPLNLSSDPLRTDFYPPQICSVYVQSSFATSSRRSASLTIEVPALITLSPQAISNLPQRFKRRAVKLRISALQVFS